MEGLHTVLQGLYQATEPMCAEKEFMPTVEVIVPAFNAAPFLAAALDSVISQSFTDWRILLVDDGSTDETAEIVASYAERLGPRLKYIHQGNAGLPAARNAAIRHAKGEYLALLDADDVWLPCRLTETLKVFARSKAIGLTYGFIDGIDPEGRIVNTFATPSRHPEGHIARYIYMRENDLPCPSITFRRACVEEVGNFDETMRATEDRDLWLRIALRYEVALVREVIAQYRTSPMAMTSDPERMFQAQLRFVEKHYGAPGCGFWARRVALSHIYRQKAEALARRGHGSAARRAALRAFTQNPFKFSNARTALSLLRRGASGALTA